MTTATKGKGKGKASETVVKAYDTPTTALLEGVRVEHKEIKLSEIVEGYNPRDPFPGLTAAGWSTFPTEGKKSLREYALSGDGVKVGEFEQAIRTGSNRFTKAKEGETLADLTLPTQKQEDQKHGIEELAHARRVQGQLEEVQAQPIKGGYRIFIGNRRYVADLYNYTAHKLPATIRAKVVHCDDETMRHLAWADNFGRVDMRRCENARELVRIATTNKWGDQWANNLQKFTGLDVQWIRILGRLAKLPRAVQDLVDDGKLKYRVALIAEKLTVPTRQKIDAGKLAGKELVDFLKAMYEKAYPKATPQKKPEFASTRLEVEQDYGSDEVSEELRKYIAEKLLGVEYLPLDEYLETLKEEEETEE